MPLHSATAENATPPTTQRAEQPPLRVTRDGFEVMAAGAPYSALIEHNPA